MNGNNQYDLVCSLEANCSVCHNLKYSGLRHVALPFDWTWFNSVEAVEKLALGFQNGFVDFMRKENLRRLEEDEYSFRHADRRQYEDTYTKFFYFNHFWRVEDEAAEIDRGISVFRKRCEKLDYFLKNSKRVLLILSVICNLPTECIENLHKVIQEKYPNCEINIHYQAFDCPEDEKFDKPNFVVRKYKRKENKSDYKKANAQWNFLDKISLSPHFFELNKKFIKVDVVKPKVILQKFSLIKFRKIKKGFMLQLFEKMNTILYCKLYIFGLRIQIILGKNRD